MHAPTWIKICGVTLPSDMEMLACADIQAVGLNFVSWSKRRIDIALARELALVANKRVELIGVVSDLSESEIRALIADVGLDRVQLHGSESADLLLRLGARAFKAVGVGNAVDAAAAASFPGEFLLVDAAVGQQSGGTGMTFDWSLVTSICRARKVVVAGGLHPENVADAVRLLCPFGVDVASGVEPKGRPGIKDPELVARFVQAVRRADRLAESL